MPSIEELPDTPPPLSPQRPNVDIPTERFTAHRRKPSVVSPIAITASSPAARRMSKRGTPQAALKDGEARLQWIARMLERWAGLGTAALIAVIVFSGTTYAELYNLALRTSSSLLPPLERTAYFAQKSNPFNQYGVKLSWLHTSIAYLFHLVTSPTSSTPSRPGSLASRRQTRSRRSRLWSYLLTSALWFAFTSWFFGYGLGDRVIQLSGGQCVIPIPAEWEIDRSGVQAVLSHVPISVGAYLLPEEAVDGAAEVTKRADPSADSAITTSGETGSDAADPILLGVPTHFCVERQPLNPKRPGHRDIFAVITHLPFPLHLKNKQFSAGDNAASRRGSRPGPPGASAGANAGLTIPRPRWYKGHDISGHTVALTIATLLLVRELAPTWARWLRGIHTVLRRTEGQSPAFIRQTSAQGDLRELIHGLVGVMGTVLVGLWVFMIGATAVYFHSPEEKFSGLALGLAISFVVYILSPSASTPSIPMSRTKTDKLAPAFDSSDDDFSVSGRAASAGTGTGVVDENAARRLAAAAMVEAEAEAQAFLDKQADVRREMDAVLKGKEKAA